LVFYGSDKKREEKLEGRMIPTIRAKSSIEKLFEEEMTHCARL
jgi:hypothetical protein